MSTILLDKNESVKDLVVNALDSKRWKGFSPNSFSLYVLWKCNGNPQRRRSGKSSRRQYTIQNQI